MHTRQCTYILLIIFHLIYNVEIWIKKDNSSLIFHCEVSVT